MVLSVLKCIILNAVTKNAALKMGHKMNIIKASTNLIFKKIIVSF